MLKRLLAIALSCAVLGVAVVGRASADAPQLVWNTVTMTAAGNTTPLQLNGQSSCSVTSSSAGTASGLNATVQVSPDYTFNQSNATWATAPFANGASITANGVTVSGSPGQNLALRINVSAITSGTVTFTYWCSATQPNELTQTLLNQTLQIAGNVTSSPANNTTWSTCGPGNNCSQPITLLNDHCLAAAKTTANLNVSTSGWVQLVAGAASENVYICGYVVSTGGATNVSFGQAPTGTCASAASARSGPFYFAANQGFTFGTGMAEVGRTTVAGDDYCVNNSAAVPLTVKVEYVEQ